MKNILRRIGVIGIIIAMLAPFIELPVVKAANEECKDHTVLQYLFLDVANGGTFNDWDNYKNGYATYAKFANVFANVSAGEKIKIINVAVDNISKKDLSKYYSSMKYLLDKTDSTLKEETGAIGAYVTEESGSTSYVSILHGSWDFDSSSNVGKDNNTRAELKEAGWYTGNDENSFINNTIQSKFDGKVTLSSPTNVDISGARLIGQRFSQATKYKSLEEFFDAAANRTDNELSSTANNIEYLSLRIERTLSDADLKKVKFGYQSEGDGKYYKYNDYTEMSKEASDRVKEEVGVKTDLDILAADQIYWPVILNVEYEICPTTNEQWSLKYDGNTDDNSVTNIPGSQTEIIGTDIQIDAKKPSRDGYTFQGWNTQRDGKGTSYNAEDTYKSPSEKTTVTLYAQWGKGGTEDQKKTGVMSYVVGFITTGLVASGIYLVAKKKNLFKQI